MATAQRIASYRHGLRAERWCAWWLRCKGYRLLARRYRTPYGEIDLIARNGHTLVCIEVKARQQQQDGLYAISPRQQERIVRAASAYLSAHPKYAGLDVRFDLMVVARRWRIHHLTQAFIASH